MTPQQAMNVAAAPLDHPKQTMADALIVLRDALRAAEGQVAAMREDAARVCDREARDADATLSLYEFGTIEHVRHGSRMTTAESLAASIRALPAPAARTYEDAGREGVQAAFDAVHRISALPYTDSPRSAFDAARIMREACEDAIAALLSPAPAVAPVAQKPGPTPDDDVLTARFQAVHRRLDVVEMYLRPLGFAGRGGGR